MSVRLNRTDKCVIVLVDWPEKDADGLPLYAPGFKEGNLTWFVFSATYCLVGFLLFMYFRHSHHFVVRSCPGISAVCFGTIILSYQIAGNAAIGYELMPCDIYLVLNSLSNSFILGGIVAQNIKFINKGYFYSYLETEVAKDARKSMSQAIRRNLRENRQLQKLKFRASNTWSTVFLLGFTAFVLVVNLVFARFESENRYFSGCTGCFTTGVLYPVQYTIYGLTLLQYIYMLRIVSKMFDPFQIFGEAKYYPLAATLYLANIVLVLAVPLSKAYFDWNNLIVLAAMSITAVMTYIQVYYVAIIHKRKVAKLDHREFEHFLFDPYASMYLQAYARDAFMSEVPAFIKDARDWVQNYDGANSLAEAEILYETYIKANATVEVNIPGYVKQNLGKKLKAAKDQLSVLERHSFNDAINEATTLLAVNMVHFYASKYFEAYKNDNPDFLEEKLFLI